MWTLVVMTVYFHAAVTKPGRDIPTLPPEMLLVMGISAAVYLAGKEANVRRLGGRASPETRPQEQEPAAGPKEPG
jgi:hypothetical protein